MAERNRSEPFIEDADRFPEDGTRTRRPPSPDQETRRRKTQQRRRRNSVFQYIAVLFMAAFVLLLFTFMMERRQSQQQIDENSSLKLRLAELEEQLEQQKSAAGDLTVSLDGVTDTLSHTENLLAWTTQAMDYFWQINDAYVRGRTQLCRELITQLESPETTPAAGPLMEYLPKENSTGTDRYSPYDRYMEIRGKVIK